MMTVFSNFQCFQNRNHPSCPNHPVLFCNSLSHELPEDLGCLGSAGGCAMPTPGKPRNSMCFKTSWNRNITLPHKML